jgi:hypothetical protein
MRRTRLIAIGALTLLGAQSLGTPTAHAGAHSSVFANTTVGIHREQIFDDHVPSRAIEAANADVVWGSSWAHPPPGVVNSGYMTQLTDGSGHGARWWLSHHRDWLEYRCDRRSLAYWPGDAGVPLDIASAAVRSYQWVMEAHPNLRAGYVGIAVDNVTVSNVTQACGHFTASGRWLSQYAGAGSAARFRRASLGWLGTLTRRVHAFSHLATVQFNYSYDFGSPWSANVAVARIADLILEERGVTNWGTTGRHIASPDEWRTIIRWAKALQRVGTCYTQIGVEPQPSSQVPLAERTWILANYLLVKGRCTYVAIVGSHKSASGVYDADYGLIVAYPELTMPIGYPLEQARSRSGGASTRLYSGGLAAVNPTTSSIVVALSQQEQQVIGPSAPASVSLAPQSAQILLSGG